MRARVFGWARSDVLDCERFVVFDWARSDANSWRILSEKVRTAAVRTRPRKPATIMGRLNWRGGGGRERG